MIKALFVVLLMATAVFGQSAKQTEEQAKLAAEARFALADEQEKLTRDPAGRKVEVYHARNEEQSVFSFKLSLNVPAKAASKGVKAREAATVLTEFRIEVTYHVATTARYDAQMEAVSVGAGAEAFKINREVFRIGRMIDGEVREMTLKYYAGEKLIASRDLIASTADEWDKISDRMLKFDSWAQTYGEKIDRKQ